MQRKNFLVFVFAAVGLFCTAIEAQMVVHAVSGTVKAINPASKTMDVTIESGNTSEFKLATDAKVKLDFDKTLEADAVNVGKFQQVGDFVVVYYYGYGDDRTAVAVKDLGPGPFEKIEGTVSKFDKRNRTMTVKDDAGKTVSFVLGDHLVVDSGMNAETGRGYDPQKGYQVRVTYTKNGEKDTAVFIRSRQ